MAEKMTLEDAKNKVNEKYNGKITILSKEYLNNKTKLLVRCNDCKNERYVSLNKLLSDSCCPTCSRKGKKNTDIFKKEVFEKYGNDYSVLGEYINCHKKN